MRVLILAGLLVTGCVPPPSSTTASPTPTAAVTASPSPAAATTSTVPLANFAEDPTARWPVVLYDWNAIAIRMWTESANVEIARPCAQVRRLEARPAGLLAWCGDASDLADLRLISIPDGRVTLLASGTRASWSADVSPDGRLVAAFRAAACLPNAPVCQTRAVLIDVASGTEREILPAGYPLGATLEWNALGLTLFQPECAEAGCAGPGDKSGTFVWDGSVLKKWDDLRFVARSGDWTLLERLRAFGQEPRTAILRGPQGEKVLSAGHALSVSANGETLVWIPGDRLVRFAAGGGVIWQASFTGSVLKMLGPDVFIGIAPALAMFDVRRLIRIQLPTGSLVTGVPR